MWCAGFLITVDCFIHNIYLLQILLSTLLMIINQNSDYVKTPIVSLAVILHYGY